jgi:hypothetical protein
LSQVLGLRLSFDVSLPHVISASIESRHRIGLNGSRMTSYDAP